MHLYHPTEKCKFYDVNGSSRPPSTTRSASKAKWLINSDFQLSNDTYTISENWEDESDFYFFANEYEFYNKTENFIDQLVSSAVKDQNDFDLSLSDENQVFL